MSLSEEEVKAKLGINSLSEISQLKMYHFSYSEKHRLFFIKENFKTGRGFLAYLRPAVDGHDYSEDKEDDESKVKEYEQGHIFGVELIQHILKLRTPDSDKFKDKQELPTDCLVNRLVKACYEEHDKKYNKKWGNIILQTEQANRYGDKDRDYLGQARFEQYVNTYLKSSKYPKIQVYYEAEAIYRDSTVDFVNTPPLGTRLYAQLIGNEDPLEIHSLNEIDDKTKKNSFTPHIPFHVFIPNIEE